MPEAICAKPSKSDYFRTFNGQRGISVRLSYS
jgi:hypothetical protein